MATAVHGKRYVETFNSATICSATANLDVAVDTAEVTTSCDDAKVFLSGKYGWTAGDSGPADFTDNEQDEDYFAIVTGGTAYTWSIKPNSAGAGATNPTYSGSAFLTSYGLSFDQANAVQQTSAYQGTGALSRATS